jgi:hypothetical protein
MEGKVKVWWRSKTLWFNIISLVVGVAGAALNVVETKWAVIGLTIVMALGNGILRYFFTDTAIGKPSA